ncbi:MAG: hypothetical protein OSA38_07510 [Candidatus Poseidoniaceae archaeon]|nr:hypothetical protein [Candidatus Poseidoniaceae archaeon]
MGDVAIRAASIGTNGDDFSMEALRQGASRPSAKSEVRRWAEMAMVLGFTVW